MSADVCKLIRDQLTDEGKAVSTYEQLREEVLKIYRATVSSIDLEKDFEQLEPIIKAMVKLDGIQDDEQGHEGKLKEIAKELKCPLE
jgi:hypothetical protein